MPARPTTAGHPPASATSPDVKLGARSVENLLDLVRAHRELVLRDLEDISVEDAPGGDPRRAHAARDQDLHRRALDDRLDEPLRRDRCGKVLVVVDDEPAVVGPLVEILGQHLREDHHLALGVLCDRESLEQAATGAVHDRAARARQRACRHGDVCRRGSCAEPADDAVVARSPLLGQDRLPVPRAGDERSDARLRPVERADQPGALDDPARCGSSASVARLPSAASRAYSRQLVERSAPAAGLGGPRALAVSGSVGDGAGRGEARTGLRRSAGGTPLESADGVRRRASGEVHRCAPFAVRAEIPE